MGASSNPEGARDDGLNLVPRRGLLLVVEDDPSTLQFVTFALKRASIDVIGATSGPAALELLIADESIDVLLADIGLPGMSGFELIRESRRRVSRLAIALMTADASLDVARNALRSEADDFISKPMTPQALVTQIKQLIARSRSGSGTSPSA